MHIHFFQPTSQSEADMLAEDLATCDTLPAIVLACRGCGLARPLEASPNTPCSECGELP